MVSPHYVYCVTLHDTLPVISLLVKQKIEHRSKCNSRRAQVEEVPFHGNMQILLKLHGHLKWRAQVEEVYSPRPLPREKAEGLFSKGFT